MLFKIEIINKVISTNNADAFLLSSDINRFWLTGFESSFGFVIATKNKIYLFLDMRYYEKAKSSIQNDSIDIIVYKNKQQIIDLLKSLGVKKLLVEKEYFLFDEFLYFKNHIETFIPFSTDVMRIQKEQSEIDLMQKAADIACETLEWIQQQQLIGLTEIEVANMITSHMLKLGATKNSFDPIVASGVNGSFPHHKPTNKKIQNNEFVTLDIGCIYKGYCSDITRTFPIGNPNPILIEAYNTVLKSNTEGINSVRLKMNGSELDKICRDIISQTKFKDYFVHSTGHGVGINVHELPNVSLSYHNPLEHNSVVTVEPGIYIPNVGGIRIEDMVLVKKDNQHVVLTAKAKKWNN